VEEEGVVKVDSWNCVLRQEELWAMVCVNGDGGVVI